MFPNTSTGRLSPDIPQSNRSSLSNLRIPAKANFEDPFLYESPRSPELNEDTISISVYRRPMANLVPSTLRKDAKNPLTTNLGMTGGGRSSSLDQTAVQLRQENDDLMQKISFLEDTVRRLRRVRVVYTERERQVKEAQAKLTQILLDTEEIRGKYPEMKSGLEELLNGVEDDDAMIGPEAHPVHVQTLYRQINYRKQWVDPFPVLSSHMESVKSKFSAFLASSTLS